MVTFFLVFIITKGALTLYEGNIIGSRAVRGGDTAQYNTVEEEEHIKAPRRRKKEEEVPGVHKCKKK